VFSGPSWLVTIHHDHQHIVLCYPITRHKSHIMPPQVRDEHADHHSAGGRVKLYCICCRSYETYLLNTAARVTRC
jgi:hypothetical protein